MKFPTAMIQAITSVASLFAKKNNMMCTHAPVAPDSLHMELCCRIEEFLEQDLFSLVIQPVVSLKDNSIFTGEVLSRLNHPERGIISPDSFLPVVDALDLYPRYDRYIFKKCCAWVSRSLAAGEPLNFISINFSRPSLCEANLARDLIEIADRYGIPHSTLGIEITEQVPESGVIHLLNNLNALRAAGFCVILDDFGSGVTSFNDLMHYPLDIVKIDRSLLLKAETPQGAAAYRNLVAMATDLGAEVVCEGIETEAQHRFAREAGCHFGQGFLFFKPISQHQIFEQIRKYRIGEDNV